MNTRYLTILFLLAVLPAGALVTSEAAQANRDDRQAEAALQAADDKAFIEGDLKAAIEQYQRILSRYSANRAVAAKALLRMGDAQENLRNAEAQKAYERLIREYGDQTAQVTEAQRRLKNLTGSMATPSLARKGLSRLTTERRWHRVTADGRYLLGLNSMLDLTTGQVSDAVLDEAEGYPEMLVPSPDGKSVAYAFFPNETDGIYELRMSPLHSTSPGQWKRLLRNEEYIYFEPFGWSPDGKEVFAILERNDNSVLIGAISTDAGSLRPIISLEWNWPEEASLSPDGRYIAYDVPASRESPRSDIFVVATDGSSNTAVVQDPSWDLQPVWTPGGDAVVFTSDRSGTLGLWTVPIADGKPQGPARLLRANIGEQNPLGFSRDGAYYYSTVTRASTDVVTGSMDLERGTLSPMKAIASFPGRNSRPSYSADGRKLAYFSNRSSAGRFLSIMVRTLATGEEREVPTLNTSASGLAWFPDGRSIVFSARNPENNRRRFHRIDLDSGEDLMAKDQAEGGLEPVVSPDGKQIYYMKTEGSLARLLAYTLETRQEKELFQAQIPPRGNVRFALSPDGREIALVLVEKNPPTLLDPTGRTTEPPRLRVVPTAGGPVRSLLSPGSVQLTAVGWSQDAKNVLVQQGNGRLWWVPADGGAATQINIGPPIPQIQSITFDGKEIAATASTPGAPPEVWVDADMLRSGAMTPAVSGADGPGIYIAEFDPTGTVRGPSRLLTDRAAGEACAPAWSPDGKSIAFFRRRSTPAATGGNFEWVVRSLDSGEERTFGTIQRPCWVAPLWSHDSKQVFPSSSFLPTASDSRIGGRDLQSDQNIPVPAAGYKAATAFSLDGRFIYMTAHDPKAKATSIVSVELATGEQRRLWSAPFPVDPEILVPLRLALSPDGRTLALVITDSKTFRLVRVGVDGSGYREVYSAKRSEAGSTPSRSALAWSADGRSILFMDEGRTEQRLMRVAANGGGKPEFTGLTIGSTDAIITLSPDGKRIAFFSPRAPTIAGQ